MSAAPLNDGSTIACSASEAFAGWLATSGGSLAITTYQAGKVVLVGWDGKQVRVLPRNFDKPMGLAVAGDRMALATRHQFKSFLYSGGQRKARYLSGHCKTTLR